MRIRAVIVALLIAAACAAPASAQHWKKIARIPGIGSAAFFFNANEGCIGTGKYDVGLPARIYYTVDGGATWNESLLPNMLIAGQVNDLYFTDRLNGWACIKEYLEHGWSGLYKTTDGGRTWMQWYQATFPVSIRQNSKAIYFTDRFDGIRRSTDGGNTFTLIVPSAGALGLDFMNDKIAIFSTEGSANEPYYTSVDGGTTWYSYQINREAWSTFGDEASGRLFIASERDNTFPGSESFIGTSIDSGKTFKQSILLNQPDQITGGISGIRGCHSVVYVQRQVPSDAFANDGMIRSTDGGASWTKVGGPYSYKDKRFAVTGRGAVVYTFDDSGGVYKTTDGGDGFKSPSAIPYTALTRITPGDTILSTLCDQGAAAFQMSYFDCDSMQVYSISFTDDTLGELSYTRDPRFFGVNISATDTITFIYRPQRAGVFTRTAVIHIRQADGYFEDTTISLHLKAVNLAGRLRILEASQDSLDFGTQSICGGDSSHAITIQNAGCSPLTVTSMSVNGASFTLASNFAPTPLDPGITRQFLITFKPSSIGVQHGLVTVVSDLGVDSLKLTGAGITGSRSLSLKQPVITSTICDTAFGTITLHNTSCSQVTVRSLSLAPPIVLNPLPLPLTIGEDSTIEISFHFAPSSPGDYFDTLSIGSLASGLPFDTTIVIRAHATAGAPDVRYSATQLIFDSVSTCSSRTLTLHIASTGCDTLQIPSDTLIADTSAFELLSDISTRHALSGDTETIVIRFSPRSVGVYSGVLHIVTTVGMVDIPVSGIGMTGPGAITLSTPSLGTFYPCTDTSFSLELLNTTCDSLTLDSVSFSGSAASDYSLLNSSSAPLASGSLYDFRLMFQPGAQGSRTATLTCYIHKNDGTAVIRSSSLDATAIFPPRIRLSLPNVALTAQAGSVVRIPVTLLDSSYIGLSNMKIGLQLRSDLLTPVSFDRTGSVLAQSASVQLGVVADSTTIMITTGDAPNLSAGLLGTLVCHTFVTDTVTTAVLPSSFVALALDTAFQSCVQTSLVLPPQSITSFTLIPDCGTPTIVSDLASRGKITIERIVPDPARSEITINVTCASPLGSDLTIEILDDAGVIVQTYTEPSSSIGTSFTKTIPIIGASGARTLRLRSTHAETLARFVVIR